ncbi:hypothetical protein BHE74_00034736, partial [Ensete ventricosum]
WRSQPPTARSQPRPPTRGRLAAARASPQGRPVAPTRGCCPRLALPPVGAATSTTGVAAPWQGGCRWARAVAACVGAATATTTAQMGQEWLGHPF